MSALTSLMGKFYFENTGFQVTTSSIRTNNFSQRVAAKNRLYLSLTHIAEDAQSNRMLVQTLLDPVWPGDWVQPFNLGWIEVWQGMGELSILLGVSCDGSSYLGSIFMFITGLLLSFHLFIVSQNQALETCHAAIPHFLWGPKFCSPCISEVQSFSYFSQLCSNVMQVTTVLYT